jgi:tetratricopeptide (TPR) repeat protein
MKPFKLLTLILFTILFTYQHSFALRSSRKSKKAKISIRKQYLNKVKNAQELFDEGKFDVALATSDPLSKKYPSFNEAFVLTGDCLFKLKAYKEAYQAFLKSLYIKTDSTVYNKALETLYNTNNSKLVTINLKRTLQKHPNDFIIRNILTSSYIKLELYDEAIEEANRILKINPWDTEALTNISLAYIYKNDLDKSIEFAEKALKQKTPSDKLHFIKGYILIQKDGNIKAGERQLIKAIKLNPFSQIYYYNLAYLYIKTHRFDTAIPLLTKAVKMAPNNEKLLFALAQSYFLANKDDKALATYSKLINLAPTSVDGYLGMGKIHLRNHQYNKTIRYFKTAMKYDSNTLSYVNILEIYFQKYFYFILTACVVGIFSIIFILKRNYETSPKL